MKFTYNIPPNFPRALAKGTVSSMYHYCDTKTSEYVIDIIMLLAGGGVRICF